jgi:hypothetical protein
MKVAIKHVTDRNLIVWVYNLSELCQKSDNCIRVVISTFRSHLASESNCNRIYTCTKTNEVLVYPSSYPSIRMRPHTKPSILTPDDKESYFCHKGADLLQ